MDSKVVENKDHRNYNYRELKKGLKIKMDCEFCKGPISASPHVYRFANYERFFCCKDACLVISKNMLKE
jgi:Lrp/AsnC family leucine-responsive transcriptional regulator